jgi:hypothetical protein
LLRQGALLIRSAGAHTSCCDYLIQCFIAQARNEADIQLFSALWQLVVMDS